MTSLEFMYINNMISTATKHLPHEPNYVCIENKSELKTWNMISLCFIYISNKNIHHKKPIGTNESM